MVMAEEDVACDQAPFHANMEAKLQADRACWDATMAEGLARRSDEEAANTRGNTGAITRAERTLRRRAANTALRGTYEVRKAARAEREAYAAFLTSDGAGISGHAGGEYAARLSVSPAVVGRKPASGYGHRSLR